MDGFNTPPRPTFTKNGLNIPPTPYLQSLGFGTGVNVWSLNNPHLNSPWAVKSVRRLLADSHKEKYQSLIEREAGFLADIHHENIIGYRGLLKSVDGTKCLAMETGGRSLGEMVEDRYETTRKPFSPKEILKVVHSVSKALNYLHVTKKLLHGDIKSYNILVKGDFEVIKLCDLGVCVQLNDVGTADQYTGTMVYNAPETFCNEDNSIVTGKAEIFSLGLVIWEMITLSPPHCDALEDSINSSLSTGPGGFDVSVVGFEDTSLFPEDKLGTRPEMPTDLGPEYATVVDIYHKCTESHPEIRPSAAELVKWIEEKEEKLVL